MSIGFGFLLRCSGNPRHRRVYPREAKHVRSRRSCCPVSIIQAKRASKARYAEHTREKNHPSPFPFIRILPQGQHVFFISNYLYKRRCKSVGNLLT